MFNFQFHTESGTEFFGSEDLRNRSCVGNVTVCHHKCVSGGGGNFFQVVRHHDRGQSRVLTHQSVDSAQQLFTSSNIKARGWFV
jgi:hypothetical protein